MATLMRLLLIGLFLLGGIAFADFERETEAADLFVRENATIERGQRVGRLFGTGAEVAVSGVVEKGVVLVDGDLVLTSSARIKGPIIVVGGDVKREAGAQLEKTVLIMAPGASPYAGKLIAGFFSMLAFFIVALPASLWPLLELLKKSSFCRNAAAFLGLLQWRWPALYIILALAISGFMMALFAELAWETLFRQQMDAVDNVFIWLVRYYANPSLDLIMVALSDLGSGFSFGLIAVFTFLRLISGRRWLESASLTLCLGGAVLLNTLLKHLFERSRPDYLRVVEVSGYSFPSGHAMVSLCFYGMLALVIIRQLADWRLRLVVVMATMGLVAGIGISRVYLGVHYPSDVAAGYAAGGMWLAFCISLFFYWSKNGLRNDGY